MSFFVSLLSVCILLYIGSFWGANFLGRIFPKITQITERKTIAFWSVLVFGGIFLSAMSSDFLPLRVVLGWILSGAFILWYEQNKSEFRIRVLPQIFLCLASVLIFGYLPLSFPSLYLLPVLATSWWLFWQIFVYFDRFPVTSSIVTVCWTIALLGVGLLQGFPAMVVSQASILGVATIAFARLNLRRKIPVLGEGMANLAGFIWAGIWCSFLSEGLVMQTICMFGYYLFEMFVLGITFIKRRELKTFLNQLIEQPVLFSKAVSTVFYHNLMLFVFAAMMMSVKGKSTLSAIIFVMSIVLLHLYMRLKNLYSPLPTFKDVFGDIKQGVVTLAQQVQKRTKKKEVKKTSLKKKALPPSKNGAKKKTVSQKNFTKNKKSLPVKKVNKKKSVKKVKK